MKIRANWVGISEFPVGYQCGMSYDFMVEVNYTGSEVIRLQPLGISKPTEYDNLIPTGIWELSELKHLSSLQYNNLSEMMDELGNISKIKE